MMNIIYIHTHDTGRYIQPYGVRRSDTEFNAIRAERNTFSPRILCRPYMFGEPCSVADGDVFA